MPASSITEKIIRSHLVSGEAITGREIALRPDQVLVNDAVAPVAFLQFERLGLDRVKVDPCVCYVDHNMLQVGFESADDHKFMQAFSARYGLYYSRPGNGICHQLHVERFAAPGAFMVGADSHTPTSGALGSLSIGVGGVDAAVAMAGVPFHLTMPGVIGIRLRGRLSAWVSAKDIAFEVLRRLTVRGGRGKILEYTGSGVATLSVPERATIANMGAEVGATTSIFPSDQQTRRYLRWQRRADDWRPLAADAGARYDDELEIDLDRLVPLVAAPHSPDNVVPVSEVEGTAVDQVCVGSCTNSSYRDLVTAARVLAGRAVADRVSLVITPGSRQVLDMISRNGALASLIGAGARILEVACGPCNAYGQVPPSEGVSVRTFNRNFKGRGGNPNASIYLASPQVAAATAIMGRITDPRKLGKAPLVRLPASARIDDRLLIPPSQDMSVTGAVPRGPSIVPVPSFDSLSPRLEGEVLLKMGDDITSEHVIGAGATLAGLRSNIPASAEYTFRRVDPTFPDRARQAGSGLLVAGENYGQGSSREHAAMLPRFLGVWAVVAKSFARIHRANLINFGVVPLLFEKAADHDRIQQGERWHIADSHAVLLAGRGELVNASTGAVIAVTSPLTAREQEIVIAGGLLNYARLSNT